MLPLLVVCIHINNNHATLNPVNMQSIRRCNDCELILWKPPGPNRKENCNLSFSLDTRTHHDFPWRIRSHLLILNFEVKVLMNATSNLSISLSVSLRLPSR